MVTPLKDPVTSKIVGAIVFGDVANDKPEVLNTALAATGEGYNGIYYRQRSNGDYKLATSVFNSKGSVTPALELPGKSIVIEAIDSRTTIVKRNITLEGMPLTVAAKSVPNVFQVLGQQNVVAASDTTPVAVLVRGTPETALNELIAKSLQTEILVIIGVLLLNALIAYLLGELITNPIRKLQQSALKIHSRRPSIKSRRRRKR